MWRQKHTEELTVLCNLEFPQIHPSGESDLYFCNMPSNNSELVTILIVQ